MAPFNYPSYSKVNRDDRQCGADVIRVRVGGGDGIEIEQGSVRLSRRLGLVSKHGSLCYRNTHMPAVSSAALLANIYQ